MIASTLVLWLFLAVGYGAAKPSYEPSVAFVCGRGSMHKELEKGWVSDPTTDCIENKDGILKYCKRVYPKLEITNIVETSSYQHVKGWCPIGKTCDSQEALKVRAYRCLTGPFQSDALIVPKECQFDHIREEKMCEDFDHWKEVAQKSCKLKGLSMDSFAMLIPCGTDVFTGVEYVCCPSDKSTSSPGDSGLTAKSTETPQVSIEVKVSHNGEKEASASSDAGIIDTSVVDKYLAMKAEEYKINEHSAFKLAKKQLVTSNEAKSAKLLKDWSEAKKRIEEMKKIDPKGAEKMSKEITPRFQKEFFALQTTADTKLIQLDSIHQQHVQTNLNAKKRKAAEKLMQALQQKVHNGGDISKHLKRYISIENKDAHHCVQHYIKLRSHDPETAQAMLSVTIEHLTLINTRIEQSIGLLTTIQDEVMEEDIEEKVRAWLKKSFTSIDGTIRKLKESTTTKDKVKQAATTEKPLVAPAKEDEKKGVVDIKAPTLEVKVTHTSKDGAEDTHMYKQFAEKLSKTDFVKKPAAVPSYVVEPASLNEGSSNHISAKVVPVDKINHMAKGESMVAQSNSIADPYLASSQTGAPLGAIIAVTMGVVGGLFMVVFLVLALRGRSKARRPSPNTYLEVSADDSLSAEDRHIASMQNGYENPTYKLLETRSA